MAALSRFLPSRREPERLYGLLFVLPALLVVTVFRLIPLVWGFGYSLTDFDGINPPKWIGLANYEQLLSDDAFLASMKNAIIMLATLPIWIALPMLLAILIHQGVPGGRFFRAVYFFPAVLSSVIIGAIFTFVLRYDGSLNGLLDIFGVPAVDWLGSGSTALPSLMAVALWSTFGMTVLIFLSGLSTVDPELVEAATLDGASLTQTWWYVIIPAIRPIIEFAAVVTMIGMLTSMFALIYVMTAGGPGTATTLPEFLIWLEQGKLNRPGYASAISVVLFGLMALLATVQIRILSRNSGI
ncbi:carbohydrate ABC transporter permease [Bauldia litoralis]|uniref:carbohydrate ABC transporter permease n=1 Tax=Bauldia litoralis TaxID=665467 RepID=UPI0032660778